MGNDGHREFQLRLLQSWQLRRDSAILHIAARQQRLIAALAITGPRPRSYLVGLLWPETPEARALESLRVSVHLISRQAPGLLMNGGTMLSLSDSVEVDLNRVMAQLREVGVAGLNGNASACLHLLRNAELLPGWYEEWVLCEQSRLRQERLHAFTIIARESMARRDYEAALEASQAALELEPLYESAVAVLVQAECKRGNFASALRAFEQYQAQLKEDMGLAPSEAVRRLAAGIRESHAQRGRTTLQCRWADEGGLSTPARHYGHHHDRRPVARTASGLSHPHLVADLSSSPGRPATGSAALMNISSDEGMPVKPLEQP